MPRFTFIPKFYFQVGDAYFQVDDGLKRKAYTQNLLAEKCAMNVKNCFLADSEDHIEMRARRSLSGPLIFGTYVM